MDENKEQPATPECQRLLALSDKTLTIGEFLEWLHSCKQIVLAKYERGELVQHYQSAESLLAEYFQIDMKKVEAERRELLAWLREQRKVEE